MSTDLYKDGVVIALRKQNTLLSLKTDRQDEELLAARSQVKRLQDELDTARQNVSLLRPALQKLGKPILNEDNQPELCFYTGSPCGEGGHHATCRVARRALEASKNEPPYNRHANKKRPAQKDFD